MDNVSFERDQIASQTRATFASDKPLSVKLDELARLEEARNEIMRRPVRPDYWRAEYEALARFSAARRNNWPPAYVERAFARLSAICAARRRWDGERSA